MSISIGTVHHTMLLNLDHRRHGHPSHRQWIVDSTSALARSGINSYESRRLNRVIHFRFGQIRSRPGQARPGQAKPGQARPGQVRPGQVRSDMGVYAGAARHRVHHATVLLQPPSGHRPGRRGTRHINILQICFQLTQPRSIRAVLQLGPAFRIPTNLFPIGRILRHGSIAKN